MTGKKDDSQLSRKKVGTKKKSSMRQKRDMRTMPVKSARWRKRNRRNQLQSKEGTKACGEEMRTWITYSGGGRAKARPVEGVQREVRIKEGLSTSGKGPGKKNQTDAPGGAEKRI